MNFNDIIEHTIKQEVESRVKQYVANYESLSEKYNELQELLQKEIGKNKTVESSEESLKLIETLSSGINVGNIEPIIISNLGFKHTDIDFSGMNTENIPKWFKILCRYFDNKYEVLNIFKLFNIYYPEWANDIVLPSYYSKEELKLCLNNINNLYVTNGQIYSGNMGFYYRQFELKKFDLAKVIESSSYTYIPYQLLLKNKLLIEDDELFELMVNKLNKGIVHSEYLPKIIEYQDAPLEKVKKLLNTNKSIHKTVLKKYPQLLKEYEIGVKFKNNISDYRGSELYVLNFNKDIQKEYFLNLKPVRSGYNEFEFVKLIDLSDEFSLEEKAELIKRCYEKLH